ncbi:MFS transporter [Spongiactinospora sp. TRM90649]|uniref:MFS transporter n=1 Tax=Spongiactinospora sp. TRM90649 TaxID=3031114 RepID=UPI0023F6B9E4|nr:MFS transporter [Spongiactinospora sp. TRM90649]MDF5756210.1 MFS transporter [Spongiactinospora sp. TRM90649]
MMRPFWLLTLAACVSRVGDQLLTVALPITVLSASGSMLLGVLSLGVMYAPYLLSPLLGVIIDRYDRRAVFAAAEITRAITVALLPPLLDGGHLAAAFTVLLVSGTAGAAASITSDFHLIPTLVPPDRVEWAYGRHSGLLQVARFAGPALAGVSVGALGVSATIWLNAATFLLTAAVAGVLPRGSGAAAAGEPGGLREMFGAGVAEFRRDHRIVRLTFALAAYNLGSGGLAGLFVVVATGTWHWPVEQVGLAWSASALATMAGSLLSRRMFPRASVERRITLWLAVCAAGGLLGLAGHPVPVLIGVYAIGLGEGGMNVATLSFRQDVIRAAYSGRVNSIIRMFVMAAIPLSSLVLGSAAGTGRAALMFAPAVAGAGAALAAWGPVDRAWHRYRPRHVKGRGHRSRPVTRSERTVSRV